MFASLKGVIKNIFDSLKELIDKYEGTTVNISAQGDRRFTNNLKHQLI